MPDKVEVLGARNLRATMGRAADDLADMRDANAEVADYVASASRSAAPRRTGALAATVRGDRATSTAVIRAGGPGVPYAGPIHWGWAARNIAAQPFIAEPAERTQPTWVGTYLSAVRRIVAQIRGT